MCVISTVEKFVAKNPQSDGIIGSINNSSFIFEHGSSRYYSEHTLRMHPQMMIACPRLCPWRGLRTETDMG